MISETKLLDPKVLDHDESKRTLARDASALTFDESDVHGEFVLNSKVCNTITNTKEKEKEKEEEKLYPTESEVASAEKLKKASKVSIKLSKPNQRHVKKKRQVSSIEEAKRDGNAGTNYG